MRSSGSGFPLKIAALIAVTLASFWAALRLFEYWNPAGYAPDDPARAPNIIEITEASYGLSCRGFTVSSGQTNSVREGNATAAVAKNCDGAIDDCQFIARVVDFGDPAPRCPKDLSVNWRCAVDQTVHRLLVRPEADGKLVTISCLRR
jgi:hypothetical protein